MGSASNDRARFLDRFWSRVNKGDALSPGACWEWVGARLPSGYGVARHRARITTAHRVAYELVIGLIPAGLQIDHLCRVRACVNPNHLEAVTQRENLLRGDGFSGRNARAAFCVNGHPWDAANTKIRAGTGARTCRACVRARNAGRVLRFTNKQARGELAIETIRRALTKEPA